LRILLFKLLIPIIAIIGIINPFYSLCVYIGFNILRPEMFFWGSSNANMIFKVSLLASLIGYLRLKPNPKKPSRHSEFWLFLWIWGAGAISLLMSSYPLEERAWFYSTELLKLWVLVYVILGVVYTRKDLLRIQHVIIIAICLLSLWGIDQHFRGNMRLEGLGGSSFGDSNSVAAAGVLYMPIALNMFLCTQKKMGKFVWLLATILIICMVIFTQSRGGFLGMMAAVAYLFLRTRRKKSLMLVCILAVFVALPFLAQEYTKRLETITAEDGHRDFSSGSRLVLWNTGVLMFLDHPVFGVGLLNFAQAKAPYKSALAGKFDPDLLDYSFRDYKVGHGIYFTQLMAEGGLLLTIPYLWLIFGFLIGATKVKRRKRGDFDLDLADLLAGMEAGIVGHCISIMFINALFFYFLPIQLVMGRQIIRVLRRNELESVEVPGGISP